ncbi:MAG TPA: D-cysteine desulfhydrase family protein [Ignavibacteria bacterium]|nr:D-cysteine desulfhydrase family protein [Ignavibacteria bacterium]HMR39878.1 D-cysteine desulfhydrase family protein [Ignavibacteria bacterium]
MADINDHADDVLGKKFPLCFLPTPLQYLGNFSGKFPGYKIFIKRDDLTGLATGGNKSRKLEYFISDALNKRSDTVITGGAQQSNHCRQTAAACAAAGLECHLVLGGSEPEIYDGNLLMSYLTGAVIHFAGENRKGEDIPLIQKKLEDQNKNCYSIPYGGSNAVGTLGFVNAVRELKRQLEEKSVNIDYIFFASSSGGTQAGLTLGMEIFELIAKLMPVSIDKEFKPGESLEEGILKLLDEGRDVLKVKKKSMPGEIPLIKGFDSAGYGVVTENEKIAVKALARSEGILLDPVYTGRAFYAMMHHLEKNLLKPGSNILFWHTGGIAVNDHYAGYLR